MHLDVVGVISLDKGTVVLSGIYGMELSELVGIRFGDVVVLDWSCGGEGVVFKLDKDMLA